MSLTYKTESWAGRTRPWLILESYTVEGDNSRTVRVVERLLPRGRDWLEMALTLFLAGAVLGAGMLTGAALLYKAVTP